MPWWAICFSIVATETSTLTFIGVPALGYSQNMTFFQLVIGYFVGRLCVSLILIPAYFKGHLHTAYELLFFRFGTRIRNFSTGLFQLTRSLAGGVRLFATALVLSVVTGFPDTWAIAIIGLITIVYTLYGGIKAVIWNDVIQLMIYMGGALLAFFILLDQIPGGWSEVTATASPLGKFKILDFKFNWDTTYTFWAGLVGGAFLSLATHGTDQMMVQRYLACGRVRQSQIALIGSGIFVGGQFLLFLLIGIMLFVFYEKFPMTEALVQSDRVFPVFIVNHMPTGVSGLVIAAILAAAMSTLSSSLNSLASSSVNDFYKNYFTSRTSDEYYLRISRIFTLMWGVILVGVALLARNWGSVLETGLTITSLTMGSVLGVFLLGLWTNKVKENAALAGMIVGLIVVLGTHLFETVAWTWYVFIGTMVTFLVGIFFSINFSNQCIASSTSDQKK